MKITMVDTGGNAKSGAWWHIHTSGCRDIKREAIAYRHGFQAFEVKKVSEFVAGQVADLNHDHGAGSWGTEHFRIMPCVSPEAL